MFENRQHAGELLSIKIPLELSLENPVVFGIARGGVIVAKEVAEALGVSLHALVIKKIGAPDNPELALGAVGPEEIVYLDHQMLVGLRLTRSKVQKRVNETKKLQKRLEEELAVPIIHLKEKSVILVDDGVATGATAICAALFADKKGAKQILLATPVIAPLIAQELMPYIDSIVSLRREENFRAVGEFYRTFPQVTTEEIQKIL